MVGEDTKEMVRQTIQHIEKNVPQEGYVANMHAMSFLYMSHLRNQRKMLGPPLPPFPPMSHVPNFNSPRPPMPSHPHHFHPQMSVGINGQGVDPRFANNQANKNNRMNFVRGEQQKIR
mmetsp:Transcript_2153/g.2766  ORF Transcript_2153/g.2766 Transcript_2153/m.2766 type:complete len:118 (-) Transcript_2153:586-939(-)